MPAPSTDKPTSNALLILFNGFNTLDANGPFEVFRKSGSSKYFSLKVASETEITTSVEGVQMKCDVALDDKLIASIADYDLLIVPGGLATNETAPVQAKAKDRDGPFMRLIYEFSKLPPTPGQNPRIFLSICTGAIFPANLGIFDGLYCTTHWGIYPIVAQYLEAGAVWAQGQPGTVIPARYVDSGVNANGVRIISSGGISCGIDASLHVVRTRYFEKEALETANLLDYAWRKTDGVIFGSLL